MLKTNSEPADRTRLWIFWIREKSPSFGGGLFRYAMVWSKTMTR